MKSIMGYPITGPAVMARYDEVKRETDRENIGFQSSDFLGEDGTGCEILPGLVGKIDNFEEQLLGPYFHRSQVWVPMDTLKMWLPFYEHNCSACQYMGFTVYQQERYDLYYCDQGGNFSTIIARWSDNGPDYFSGLLGRSSLLLATEPLYPLVVGRRWAIALGYIEGE